ncbi:18785_t:CDS:2, partial [Racocetra persica]
DSRKKLCAIGTCSVGDEEKPKYNKLILSDIAIRLVFISVHTGQIRNLLRIALLEGISKTAFGDLTGQQWVDHYKISIAWGAILLTLLLSTMRLNFYLVRISIYYREISCDNTGCLLKNWNFYMCYQFDKNEQKVCMLLEEDEIDQNIFDISNFALIIVINYMQRFFKTRRKCTKILLPDPQNQQQQDSRYLTDALSYYLEEKFSLPAEQSGLPQLQQDQNETQRPDTIKLIDNGNLDQRINNLKLLPNLINDLQKLRISRLDKLHLEQYDYYTDLKDKTEEISMLNNLFNIINNNKVLTAIQISTLLK